MRVSHVAEMSFGRECFVRIYQRSGEDGAKLREFTRTHTSPEKSDCHRGLESFGGLSHARMVPFLWDRSYDSEASHYASLKLSAAPKMPCGIPMEAVVWFLEGRNFSSVVKYVESGRHPIISQPVWNEACRYLGRRLKDPALRIEESCAMPYTVSHPCPPPPRWSDRDWLRGEGL